jgi:hypothetical protein
MYLSLVIGDRDATVQYEKSKRVGYLNTIYVFDNFIVVFVLNSLNLAIVINVDNPLPLCNLRVVLMLRLCIFHLLSVIEMQLFSM